MPHRRSLSHVHVSSDRPSDFAWGLERPNMRARFESRLGIAPQPPNSNDQFYGSSHKCTHTHRSCRNLRTSCNPVATPKPSGAQRNRDPKDAKHLTGPLAWPEGGGQHQPTFPNAMSCRFYCRVITCPVHVTGMSFAYLISHKTKGRMGSPRDPLGTPGMPILSPYFPHTFPSFPVTAQRAIQSRLALDEGHEARA